jgi:hypothetical protein
VAIKPYVLKLRPKVGESLLGYIHRLGIRNGHDLPHWTKADIALKPTTYSLTQQNLEKLSIVSGRPVEELAAMQSPPFTKRGRRTTFMGWSIPDAAIERGLSRLCPVCISEDPFHRQIWNLRIATACPVHGAALIDKCPVCREPLHWGRLDVFRCSRGHHLKHNPQAGSNGRVPPSELFGVRAIYEKCGSLEGAASVLSQVPEAIQKLDLMQFGQFLLVVGRVKLGDNTSFRPRGVVRYDSIKAHRILQAGFDVARNWPTSFTSLIGELHREARRARHRVGLGKEITTLVRTFAGSPPLLEIIKGPIGEYVSARQIYLQKRTRLLLDLQEPDATQFVSLKEAAETIGCCEETARNLALRHKWIAGAPGSGHVYLIPRSKVEEWAKREATISLKKAGKLLGLWRAAATTILERGLVRCVRGCSSNDHSCGYHIVRKAEVDKLLNAIQKSTLTEPRPDRGPLVSWRGYQKRGSAEGVDAGIALKAIVEGRLVAYGKRGDQKGFDGLLFHLLDLTDISANEPSGPRRAVAAKRTAVSRHVSTNDAALIAGMHCQSIFRALELKLISSRVSRGPRSARLIELAELRQFMRDYTTITKLVREHNLHTNTIKSILGRLRVQPAGGTRKGKYVRSPIYSCAELKRAKFFQAVAEHSSQRASARPARIKGEGSGSTLVTARIS